ncbi:MAG: hypothetical protein HC837_21575 [Chloroflexaceae bacterium]|nr:hypothetical protein [Chloroflexaceae bacterium]
MIDERVQFLLEQAINTPMKPHMVLILHEDHRAVVTPTIMAGRVCRDIWCVAQALQELAEDGILVSQPSQREPIYTYQPRDEHQETICQLLSYYYDPIARNQLLPLLQELVQYVSLHRMRSRVVVA